MAGDANPEGMYERAEGSRPKLWLLLGANRLVVSALVLVALFVGIVAVLLLDPASFERAIQRGDPVQTVFQALVTVTVTGTTLVVSINSLVLSQELGPVGDQRDQMDESIAFRDEVAELIGAAVGPAEPSHFLRAMLEETGEQAAHLREEVASHGDRDVRESITNYADSLERDTSRAAEHLAGAEFGTFAVVAGALDVDYSRKLYTGKRLASEHDATLEDGVRDRLEDIVELLRYFGPAREHVKTLYFQWELVDLSRAILYAAIPATVVGIIGVLVLGDPALVSGRTLGLANHAWIVAGAVTLTLSPFAILIAYILRVATVAKRTLAIGPFVLRGVDETETETGAE